MLFLALRLIESVRRSRRQYFQTPVAPDAVLDVDDAVPFFELGEIDVERRTHGRCAWSFKTPRTLDFVSSEDFCVGDDHQFSFIENEASTERAEVQLRAGVSPARAIRRFLTSGKFGGPRRAPRSPGPAGCLFRLAKAIILPNLVEPLPLAFVVTENVNRVALAQPAMDLPEKLPALRFGNLRFRRAITQWAERVERGKRECRGL